MTRKTGNKWMTMRCGRCHKTHVGYSGKLDRFGVEYVVCEVTNKRMNIADDMRSLFFTTWVFQENKEYGLVGESVLGDSK